MAISKEIRQQVRERAKYLCEYCHSSEEASAARFEIDHIQPRSLGGTDTIENLVLACQRCNSYRYNFTEGIDPESQVSTQLFNPRLHQWNEHFIWEKGGLEFKGKTPIGRATCDRQFVGCVPYYRFQLLHRHIPENAPGYFKLQLLR